MKNEYYKIPVSLIESLKKLTNTLEKRGNPHQNLHYSLSVDGTQAIIQADFNEQELDWLSKQMGVVRLGKYNKGFAEKAVSDYILANKTIWQEKELVVKL